MVQFLDFLGYTEMVVKCDQESSLKAVIAAVRVHMGDRVKEWKPDQISVEFSPTADSRSNGLAERAVRTAEGQIRTLRSALEEHIGASIAPDACIMPWLIQHAGETISPHRVGSDGKVAYQRLRGGISTP